MGVWKFSEKFGQGGHVLKPTSKSWPHVQKYVGRRKEQNFWRKQFRAPMYGRRVTSGCQPVAACSLTNYGLTPPFLGFWHFFFTSFLCHEDRLGILGEWMYNTPIFWSLPLHLGGWNLPFLIELRKLINFFKLVNLECTWTFISTVGIFVSWKSEFTENSSRFASLMEIFCTLLQYKVHLSMFHSWSTSKIWYTST
jgi:hypothetical protein